jgi:hypothetical protein
MKQENDMQKPNQKLRSTRFFAFSKILLQQNIFRIMASPSVSSLLEGLATAGKAFDKNEAGSREALIDQSRALIAVLEIPSEFVQRSFWAEVSNPLGHTFQINFANTILKPAFSANIRLSVDVKLFQHLNEAGATGLSAAALSEKTGVDVVLLQRLTRHLVAMHLITYLEGAFHATKLSDSLA